jgi:hypothetical protein
MRYARLSERQAARQIDSEWGLGSPMLQVEPELGADVAALTPEELSLGR